MLTSAFYEAVCGPGTGETGLQKEKSSLPQGDEKLQGKASAVSEAKPLPSWYARLYCRRLTICLWLLVAACVVFLAPLVRIADFLSTVQILGGLYCPGLAFCLWNGLKALSDVSVK